MGIGSRQPPSSWPAWAMRWSRASRRPLARRRRGHRAGVRSASQPGSAEAAARLGAPALGARGECRASHPDRHAEAHPHAPRLPPPPAARRAAPPAAPRRCRTRPPQALPVHAQRAPRMRSAPRRRPCPVEFSVTIDPSHTRERSKLSRPLPTWMDTTLRHPQGVKDPHQLSHRSKRKKTPRNEGWEENRRVPTCTGRILARKIGNGSRCVCTSCLTLTHSMSRLWVPPGR